MLATSRGVRLKPSRSKFAAIRSGRADFGMTVTSCSRCQRSTTWAGSYAVRGGDLRQHRVVQVGVLQRAVALDRDAALGVPGEHPLVVAESGPSRSGSPLASARSPGQVIDLGQAVVADADVADEAVGLDLE